MATKDKLINLEDLKAVYDHGTELLEEKADKVGSYPGLIAGTADNLLSSSYQTDRTPYILRRTPYGAREKGNIVGGSIVWNQLCNNASVTVVNGHKYLLKKDGAYSIGASTGTALTGLTVGSDMVIDLTLMFGPTIADYIYTQEQATAGAGVALAKAWAGITADYYPYDVGSIKSVTGLTSHKMTGFNQWDEEWEAGDINPTTGQNGSDTRRIRSKNYCPAIPNAIYSGYMAESATKYINIFWYDADKSFIKYDGITLNGNQTVTAPDGASYFRILMQQAYGTTYLDDICINFSSSRNGQYEPYAAHTYPLDSSLTLRGVLKLDGDNLYYDGDIYKADGSVTRRYEIVDLGTMVWNVSSTANCFYTNSFESAKLYAAGTSVGMICPRYTLDGARDYSPFFGDDKTLRYFLRGTGTRIAELYIHDSDYSDAASFKTAMSGVYLVYELAEPTTEQAEPYTALQICDPAGTEEWVGASMPVGHETQYYEDLKGKIEDIPDAPSANGTYTLRVTVSNGVATYSWE